MQAGVHTNSAALQRGVSRRDLSTKYPNAKVDPQL
jgi:hypothetical protein